MKHVIFGHIHIFLSLALFGLNAECISEVLCICLITGAFFCRADEFICNNTLCKLHMWVCDGEDDCGDNSDEDPDMCGALKLSFTRLSIEDMR